MIDNELRGKVVLACGATQGAMRAAARLFGSAGAWVAVVYRSDIVGAKSLVDEIRAAGGRALPTPGDVRTQEGAWSTARFVESEWAQIDVLLFASPLASEEEAALDPTPTLDEVLGGMRGRGWGRVVLVRPHDFSEDAPPVDPALASLGILANTLLLPGSTQLAHLEELAAWTALFLGSGWNSRTSGATIAIK